MKHVLKALPWLLLALFATEIVVILLPRRHPELLEQWGRLPVLLGGRVQPFDSVGRNALLQIRGTASVPLEEKKSYEFWKHPKKLKATVWLAEVMTQPGQADTRPIFLIHHPDLLNELELRGKGKEKSGLFYFTFNELTNCLDRIEKEGQQVQKVEGQNQTAYQKQVAKLHNALSLYRRLKNSLQPEASKDFVKELADFRQSIPAGIAAFRASQAGQEFDEDVLRRYARPIQAYDLMSRLAYPLIVPSVDPQTSKPRWRNMGEVLIEAGVQGTELPPAVGWLARMATACQQNDTAGFTQAAAEYRAWLATNLGPALAKGRQEFFFNNLQAFLHAMIIYLFAFVLAVGAMLTLSLWPQAAEALRRSAFYLIALGLVVHTAGLVLRMYLERRPPVTNLYSSAIFIGWMSVVLGLFLERIYRVGIGAAAGSLVGAITLIIAHNLSVGGDTMEMMRAVLDTNFWLATHVVTITLGYAANFVAGLLAMLYVLAGLLSPLLARKLGPGEQATLATTAMDPAQEAGRLDIGQALTKMVYGIICFATLFSFVGTVLGGIWADQSWGRFWGWDPKENGALIIVLWNALILHARWGGMVGERGLMNLAIFGNIVTSFSWFGVNMLGVGLHSYGFMDAAFMWLVLAIVIHGLWIGAGCLPLRCWWSQRERERRNPLPETPEGPADGPSAPASARG